MADAVDTLGRAIGIIQRNMQGSAVLQGKVDTSSLNKVIQGLSVVVDAAETETLQDKLEAYKGLRLRFLGE